MAAQRYVGSKAEMDESKLALMRAVKEGSASAVHALIGGGADVNFQNHHGDTSLILAAWYGHLEIAQALTRAGARPDLINCDGNSAINCAAYRGSLDLVSMLLHAGATVDIIDTVGPRPRGRACARAHDHAAAPPAPIRAALPQVTGKTALIKAAYVGHAHVVQALLAAGSEKDAADANGYTALAFATSFNHREAVQVSARTGLSPPS